MIIQKSWSLFVFCVLSTHIVSGQETPSDPSDSQKSQADTCVCFCCPARDNPLGTQPNCNTTDPPKVGQFAVGNPVACTFIACRTNFPVYCPSTLGFGDPRNPNTSSSVSTNSSAPPVVPGSGAAKWGCDSVLCEYDRNGKKRSSSSPNGSSTSILDDPSTSARPTPTSGSSSLLFSSWNSLWSLVAKCERQVGPHSTAAIAIFSIVWVYL